MATLNENTEFDPKNDDLNKFKENGTDEFLTTNQGVRINDNQNSLKSGERGATLLEDFILREKITHFDHERIPERIVHARGAAAHGFFQVYEPMAKYTKAGFLNDPDRRTPVFARFSTVAGSRGSTDLARDVRGFSVKFYTEEGNYDLVGNNMPVFFIQDAIKFPDLIHAVKPEPHNEIPQAASAHDTFWDFISLMPESTHMIMWLMSDRAIPRSLRMMEGFGVHTFRLINEAGEAYFVKFHWKPLLGVHSVLWDEALQISGKDPDFHRRDLWEAIENGFFPEWELGMQIIPEADEHRFDFDLLDPTKLVPEELVPVMKVGKMTLNRNPDNYFAETEQVAFHPGHLVPGIDFTNDPLLQGRLFSYTDTQLSRLGSPNFHEIPINRSINTVHNNQRDGHMRQMINKGKTSYDPNSMGGGCPFQAQAAQGGFTSYAERVDGKKIRGRSASFMDHFSQAALFYNSQSEVEKEHIVEAFSFELGKVELESIRERMIGILTEVDLQLATQVADNLGLEVPKEPQHPLNHGVPADADPIDYQPTKKKPNIGRSEALSMANTIKDSINSRQIAILADVEVDMDNLMAMKTALENVGGVCKIIAPKLGYLHGMSGEKLKIDMNFKTGASVFFDAVYVAGGTKNENRLLTNPDAIAFVNEAYRHGKPIAVEGDTVPFLELTMIKGTSTVSASQIDHLADQGILVLPVGASTVGKTAVDFILAIAQHRFWNRV
ncbi:catalase [Dyadobacter jejuensis]|uniref:Catalase n=1 Tax=Dyadobacter jejuensis TaxID=1082580 RepID=A0A316B2S7_9BACT|nr:catalase [Dyadobacter jejuensis]PWJ56847.1 catalase [Dyadobacter jejuensis]